MAHHLSLLSGPTQTVGTPKHVAEFAKPYPRVAIMTFSCSFRRAMLDIQYTNFAQYTLVISCTHEPGCSADFIDYRFLIFWIIPALAWETI